MTMTMLGRGVYTFAEAARLTKLRVSRIREWFGERRQLFASDYEPVGGNLALSFFDLIDAFVAGSLRDFGVSMPTVRKVYARLANDLDTKHPFCRQELLTDGKNVFTRDLSESLLIEVITKQGAFAKVLEPFLESIDYDHVALMAARWRISDDVVIDPKICFGAPVVEEAGIPTSVLAKAYAANDRDALAVARWYGVEKAVVLKSVEFERNLAA